MQKLFLTFIFLMLLTGCGNTLQKFRQESKLNNADNLLRKGDVEPAIKLLKEISNDKGIIGVTDEAMFRLALAYLINSSGNNHTNPIPMKVLELTSIERITKSEVILIKLQKDYPHSIWAIQSYPIIDIINNFRTGKLSQIEMDQEINSLKQENKKLKMNIERLKSLDIEMEKSRRN